MRKRKTVALVVAVLVLAFACTVLLAACNEGPSSPASKGVSRPENTFTDNLDKTDSENLVADAALTASSASSDVANLTDADTDTVWTAETVEGEYIEIRFASPTTVNTIVLRENGNFVTGFRFLKESDGAWEEFYRQDRMERYRYCTFDAETVTAIRIAFDGANEGRAISVSEIEVYNIAPKTYQNEFRVFSYYNSGDFLSPALDDEELAAQLDVVTDVIMFLFVYWDGDGNLVFQEDPENPDADGPSLLLRAIDKIKELGGDDVNICIDLYPTNLAEHGLPENTDKLVANIAAFVREYDIDGVDFDWEYPTNPAEWYAYGDMMMKLKNEIAKDGKYVSVALSNFNVRFTQEQIEAIDYVQIMGYDRFDVDGNNSSFRSGAYLPMRYFVNLGFEPSQLIAGMPVYGRPDNETVGETWTNYYYDGGNVYADEAMTSPYTVWDNAQWITYDGKTMKVYVTGAAMAADKTAYAIEQGFAGVMLFRNLIDYPIEDERSVVGAIGKTIAERIA